MTVWSGFWAGRTTRPGNTPGYPGPGSHPPARARMVPGRFWGADEPGF
jgi:hypothetical protein